MTQATQERTSDEMAEYTDAQIDAAPALLKEFLEGMPEIVVNRDSPQVEAQVGLSDIVTDCHDGDDHAYIQESFVKFLEQFHC